jgi:hypothetical protein
MYIPQYIPNMQQKRSYHPEQRKSPHLQQQTSHGAPSQLWDILYKSQKVSSVCRREVREIESLRKQNFLLILAGCASFIGVNWRRFDDCWCPSSLDDVASARTFDQWGVQGRVVPQGTTSESDSMRVVAGKYYQFGVTGRI